MRRGAAANPRAAGGVLAALALVAWGCTGQSCGSPDGATHLGEGGVAGSSGDSPGTFRVLLFSRTAVYRHDAIPTALAALKSLAGSNGFVVDATEDPARFSPSGLSAYQVVVFLMTTGDVLNEQQQTAFEGFITAGGGFVGVHSASDTEYDWPFYGALVGAYFFEHPAVQSATVRIEKPDHPAMLGLPAAWTRTDEWYDFRTNPRPNVTVLATLDESTYAVGRAPVADHPIVWCHDDQGGRAFYTALGHTAESYADAAFRQHLVGALRWAAGRAP